MEFMTGAGHPGEEDVPGLVLVCRSSWDCELVD